MLYLEKDHLMSPKLKKKFQAIIKTIQNWSCYSNKLNNKKTLMHQLHIEATFFPILQLMKFYGMPQKRKLSLFKFVFLHPTKHWQINFFHQDFLKCDIK